MPRASTGTGVLSVGSITISGGTVSVTQGTSPWVVSGTVTASAGTNLNTSALNLETTQTAFSAKFPSAASVADDTANPSLTQTQTFPMMLDSGGTWDRQRSAVAAYGSFGDGVQGVGIMAESPSDFRYYTVYADHPSADGISGASPFALFTESFGYMSNGTTWDRVRGDTTNGLLVNLGANNDVTVTGTVTVTPSGTQDVNLTQSGGVTITAATALGATMSNPTPQLVGSFNMLFANTAATWNRMRSIENGVNSTGSGIINAGMIAQFDDTSPGTITENNFAPVRMSTNRNLYGTIRDAAGNERGLNVASTGNISIDTVTAVTAITNALPAGTNAIGKLAANSGVDIGDVDIGGGLIADDSPTPGNPVMVGGFAISPDGTSPGAVAEADVARFRTDLNRRLLVNDEHPQWWSYHEDSSSALTDATVQASPGAGFQIVITEIIFSTGAATACNIFFEEGASKVLGPWYLEAVAGRGLVWRGKKHITAATAVTVTTSAAIAHGLDIQGYIQAV